MLNGVSLKYIANWETQVRKGVLAFIILSYLKKRTYYGYELISEIKNLVSIDIAEGTIYPLLNRLKKDNLIESEWVEMEAGIPRKYYKITDYGIEILAGMQASWIDLNTAIQKLSIIK
jgi:PadR family transcriptional regulator, regulatory protein PadR